MGDLKRRDILKIGALAAAGTGLAGKPCAAADAA